MSAEAKATDQDGPETPPSADPPSRVFYGWWIVAAGFLVQVLSGALLFHGFGAYVLPLQAAFGWSRTELSGAFALVRAESGFLGPLQGWLIDRYGPRRIMSAGIVFFGGGFLLFSRIDTLLEFYACFALIALGSSLGGFLSVMATVANWFRRRRSMAMGIAMAGMGVGGLMLPGVMWLLTTYGWRHTAALSGVIILVAGLPATQLMRHRPEAYGFLPDGEPASTGDRVERPTPEDSTTGQTTLAAGSGDSGSSATRSATGDEPAFTAREAMRTPAFWLLSTVHGTALLVVGTALMHQIPHMVEHVGLTEEQAASIVALLVLVAVMGQLVGGYLGDRLDKRLIIFAAMWMHAAAMVIFTYATSVIGAVGFTVLHGAAWGVRGTLMSTIRADYFGRRSFATISGFSSLIVMVGMTTGMLFSGYMHDLTGNYRLAFLSVAGMAALGSVAALLAVKPVRQRRLE